MTDTHTHLYLPDYPEGGVPAVTAALEAGVSRMVFPNVDYGTLEPMFRLHEKFPSNTFPAVGLHPTEVDNGWREVMEKIEPYLDYPGVKAVGEVGIDLYWDRTYRDAQIEAFDYQLETAYSRELPVIIHSRDGLEEILDIFAARMQRLPEVVFHSFTLGAEEVRKIRKFCDPMFGINGVVTFRNAKDLRDALPEIGIYRIMLETDSPYLTPVPHRGRQNSSAYIPLIASAVASGLGLTTEDVCRRTDENATRFFRLPEETGKSQPEEKDKSH